MIKLYNLSRLSDASLRPLLLSAQQLAGCHGSVVVKITRGGYRVTSHAAKCDYVQRWFLSSRQYCRGEQWHRLKRGWIATNGGYVVMQPRRSSDPLADAERFFETAIHEFAHIADFQRSGVTAMPWSKRSLGGRRPCWERRPEEIRAQNVTDAALAKIATHRVAINDLILSLAVEMEQIRADRHR